MTLRRGRAASFFLGLALAAAAPLRAGDRIKIVLDTDIGTDIDDAWALGFALSHPGFELLGVTVTDGDTHGRARGSPASCSRSPDGATCRWRSGAPPGPAGAPRSPVLVGGGLHGQAADGQARGRSSSWIREEAPGRDHPHRGRAPSRTWPTPSAGSRPSGRYLKRVVLMSGCIRGTADQPAKIIPEWNVVSATADAQLVYSAGLPLTIVPLDSTTQVRLADRERERLKAHRSPLTASLESLYRLWIESPGAADDAARPAGGGRDRQHRDLLRQGRGASPVRGLGRLYAHRRREGEEGRGTASSRAGTPSWSTTWRASCVRRPPGPERSGSLGRGRFRPRIPP